MTLTKDDLQAIRNVVQEEIRTELNPVKKDLKKIKKDTTYIIDALDRELMHQAKRVDRIENVLKLPPLEKMAEI